MEDSKGLLFGGGWFEANEMWSRGCQSFVATRSVNGRESSAFMVGAMVRPPSTASEPFLRAESASVSM